MTAAALKDRPTASTDLDSRGFALLHGAMNGQAGALASFDALLPEAKAESRRIDPGHPLVAALLDRPVVRALVMEVLGPKARAVRAIAFDKTNNANWFVPWHQDRTIAVREKDESAQVTHWTVKAGLPHCEAPIPLLENMLTLRWHLDLIGPDDGGLRVLPGSHRLGRLDAEARRALAAKSAQVELAVSAGTVVAMRPLLVHGSRRRTTQGHRRVLHVELAAGDPPPPLRWAWA